MFFVPCSVYNNNKNANKLPRGRSPDWVTLFIKPYKVERLLTVYPFCRYHSVRAVAPRTCMYRTINNSLHLARDLASRPRAPGADGLTLGVEERDLEPPGLPADLDAARQGE